ncbi:ABC transporter ATP-binding protein [Pseudonocardia kunmingensis]|uniref:Oligopeptide transport system ATP-binding protein n=1 Tax=Pseudonocardia kunmingensis TaxID=630975 RepID=A0A543CX07_9PSEU|nr:oligopeptide/dipeptide ABC transporter ATP-binding protein [Pseudonocardia kunmingensis]TQM01644.1 oligopeptide transport system ATP-binding protein [Pseudonocardia kunmingensis]
MTCTTDRPLLDVVDLAVSFKVARAPGAWKRSVVRAVDGVSLRIDPGETLGLVGESGSGKSTTGRAVLQLVPLDAGSIHLEGTDLTGAAGRELLRKRAQMVFQDPFGSLNARMKVGEIIREPLEIHRIGDRASRRRRVTELLDLVGLPADSLTRYPHEFSGGQRQRIGIARALAVEPALVVCDEPVAALDVSVQAQILRLLKDLQREMGVAYLFIAHDLNVVRHVSRRTAVMYLGKIVEEGPSGTVFTTPRHPYTQALTSAIPVPDPDAPRRRRILTGEIPSPTDPPSGCRFRTRCPFAQDRCATEEPRLEPAGDGVSVACHFWREIDPSMIEEVRTTP